MGLMRRIRTIRRMRRTTRQTSAATPARPARPAAQRPASFQLRVGRSRFGAIYISPETDGGGAGGAKVTAAVQKEDARATPAVATVVTANGARR